MKRHLALTLSIVALAASVGSSMAIAADAIEEEIVALEKAGWNAWMTKDASWFQRNTVQDAMWISSDGMTDKAQYLKGLPTACEIKRVSLTDFKFGVKGTDLVVMTYTARQDGTCEGKPVPPMVRASVVYVKRGGKWLEALYMETPATP